MGTYLSTPLVEKGIDEGECLDDAVSPLAWGVVEMQGWRKSMEDAHVAQTDVDLHWDSNAKAKVFGVFDGHGGPEVARFCQLYLLEALTKQEAWKEEMTIAQDEEAADSAHIGQALINAFHTLDRLIDDQSFRDELYRLRTYKPKPDERRTIDLIPSPLQAVQISSHQVSDEADSTCEGAMEPGDQPLSEKRSPTLGETDSAAGQQIASQITSEVSQQLTQATKNSSCPDMKPVDLPPDTPPPDAPPPDEVTDEQAEDESTGMIGMDDGEEVDFPLEDDEYDFEKSQVEIVHTETSLLFRSFVGSLKGDSGKVTMILSPSSSAGGELNTSVATKTAPAAKPTPVLGMIASTIQNGRQYCNLPDHPVHAGCTAIVAVIIGRTLTVANAGDSRAVLCRAGGRTEPLSFDHKPHHEREMLRIANSGGFVNQFGRVNGNLNLSRSIGDLKYKQIPGLSPAEQMITAEPDIVQVTLRADDEFIILGCDGIWDCLSNDQAVKYVRDRIDFKSAIQIGTEMLDDIISDDPRASQGIGGDNMTVMIIDLQPSTRSYR